MWNLFWDILPSRVSTGCILSKMRWIGMKIQGFGLNLFRRELWLWTVLLLWLLMFHKHRQHTEKWRLFSFYSTLMFHSQMRQKWLFCVGLHVIFVCVKLTQNLLLISVTFFLLSYIPVHFYEKFTNCNTSKIPQLNFLRKLSGKFLRIYKKFSASLLPNYKPVQHH